jgi:predicted PolB exonuclease-like 3'-5' exonuclease
MKYSFDIQNSIIELKEKGYSGDAIAEYLQVSKSGVNECYARYLAKKQKEQKEQQGPRILFFDLETSAALVYCFGRHKQFISQDAVHTEGGKILCAGYRWDNEEKSTVLFDQSEVKQGEDYLICSLLHDLFSKADVVVAHNAKNFDVKMLEVRCLANGLPPLPTVKVVDTLEIAKAKFRFASNKLDSLGAFLGIGRKVAHSGIDLWVKVQQGDIKALKEMVVYCEQDVDLLYEVFMILRNRGLVTGINFATYFSDDTTRCKVCGSDNLELTGRVVTTGTGVFNEVECLDCGTLHKQKTNKLSAHKRKKLLG